MRDYYRDLEAFMKQEIKKPTAIYGHSLGGWLTMMLAANNVAMVKGIVFGDIVTYLDKYIDSDPAFWNSIHELVRSKNAYGIFQSLRDIMDSHDFDTATLLYWSNSLSVLDPDAIAQFVEMHKDSDKFGDFFKGFDPDEPASRITCPVLFLHGNHDLGANILDDDFERHSGVFSNVITVKIKETGHMLHLKSREPVLRAVTYFLESPR